MPPREVFSLQAVGEGKVSLHPYFPLPTMPLLHNRHVRRKGTNAELQKPVQQIGKCFSLSIPYDPMILSKLLSIMKLVLGY